MKNSLAFRWMSSSPTQIWKSRISWRIALAVFLTILTVQAGILNVTLRDFENGRIADLRETGRSALVPLIDPTIADLLAPPISDAAVNRLMSTTKINGLAVYSSQLDLIKTYGEPMATMLTNKEALARDYRSVDGNSYEAVFRANDLNRPFIIVARMNSSYIQGEVINYVRQTIMIMLLMSAFVTSVLMLALGHWLLEPILFMRANLLEASKNPEAPEIQSSPYDPSDEIGGAIELAENLIRQNAENIKRIKSAAEDKIHKLAYYDTLTGLPNRTLFLQTLGNNARQSSEKDQNERFAVIALDLDHFKDVNDSMGHNVGDAILRSVGKRLKSALPDHAMVSRSGEDEFAVMMKLDDDYKTARSLADKLSLVIKGEPFKVFNEQFQIRSSIGVSTFPDDGLDPDQVLKNADIALNRAKEEGRDTIKEYSEDFDRAVQARFQLLRDLRDALEHKQLRLFYQPQLDLNTGKVIGSEALIRWWKPDNSKQGGTFISPGEFIPVAEQSGLIVPIGAWVLRQACEDAKRWEAEGIDIRIAINVSAAQFAQGDMVENVEQVLRETGLEPRKLELEVTESVFMDDIQHTIQTLQNLHALGVELAIDDFGTGYSSLSYLRQFPIDRLKIDQSFIRNALNNPDDASIAKTIVGLGHSLNLKVIAEGVETKEHEEFLLKHHCDEVQGFRYSRPVPHDDFIAFIKNYDGKLSSFDKQ
jgi:diguanylate cyclase (GGDEF)-like protein